MHLRFLTLLISLFFLGCAAPKRPVAQDRPGILVSAGAFNRTNCVVTFDIPSELSGHASLVDDQGVVIPLQIQPGGPATFILPSLAAGAKRRYYFLDAAPLTVSVTVERQGSRLAFSSRGKPTFTYQAEPGEFPRPFVRNIFRRGGYLHPVFSPSGKMITDDYATNHFHHHGIWMAWTKTEYEGRSPDFWNMGDAKGKVEFAGLSQSWNGPVHAGLIARHRFVDTTTNAPRLVLEETWAVTGYDTGATAGYHLFDVVSEQACASQSALRLPTYHYGGLGFRGHESWNGKDRTFFLTSEGIRDRVKGNTTTARWCDISGDVDGARAGVTILNHPTNFRSPATIRLHPTEPFFCYAPQQGGDMEIVPGQRYLSRYRFLVHDGPPNAAEIERVWNDYANPPSVMILPR